MHIHSLICPFLFISFFLYVYIPLAIFVYSIYLVWANKLSSNSNVPGCQNFARYHEHLLPRWTYNSYVIFEFQQSCRVVISNTKPSKCICGLAVLPWLSIHLKGPDCSAACYFHIVGSSVGMEMILLPEIVVLSMVSCRRIDQIHCHTPVKLLFIASYETQCLRGIWFKLHNSNLIVQ